MRKKLGLWVAGSAAIILLGWGVTALVTGDGKSKDSAEVAAISLRRIRLIIQKNIDRNITYHRRRAI